MAQLLRWTQKERQVLLERIVGVPSAGSSINSRLPLAPEVASGFDPDADTFVADRRELQDAMIDLCVSCEAVSRLHRELPLPAVVAECCASSPSRMLAEPVDGERGDNSSEGESSSDTDMEVADTGGKPLLARAPSERCGGWVVTRGCHPQVVKIINAATHGAVFRESVLLKCSARTRFLLHVDQVFGPALLAESPACLWQQEAENTAIRESLAAIQKHMDGVLWGLPLGGLPTSVLHAPPPELFMDLTLQELVEEYGRFRQWVRRILEAPFAFEFYNVQAYMLEKAPLDSTHGHELAKFHTSTSGVAFQVRPSDVREACRWQRYIPRPGTLVTSKVHGRCRFLKAIRTPDMSKLYAYVMTAHIGEIRSIGIWHIVAALHRCAHISIQSESLAETVGSLLRLATAQTTAKGNGGSRAAVEKIVRSTQLRCAGIRGLGGEEGILATALNHHFGGHGPADWHFCVNQGEWKRSSGSTVEKRVLLRRQVRGDALPRWLATPLQDLHATGQLQLCKRLPEPWVFGAAEAREADSLTVKQQVVLKAAAREFAPDRLADRVWAAIGATKQALHLRPRITAPREAAALCG